MIRSVAVTGSTNADLIEAAATGAPDGLWLRADRQTSGRGRMGREWQSVTGNLHASHLVRLRPSDPSPPSLAFVAAVAVCETLLASAPLQPIQIKWPNDVMAGDAKLAGILLERSGDAVVVGIGVNLAHAPEGLLRAVTSLKQLGITPPQPGAFLSALAAQVEHWLNQWRNGKLDTILARWQALAHPIGTPLSIYLPDGERLEGAFDGLTADGALSLRLADGQSRVIHAGDVFFVGDKV